MRTRDHLRLGQEARQAAQRVLKQARVWIRIFDRIPRSQMTLVKPLLLLTSKMVKLRA